MSPTVTVRVARASRAAPCNAGGASAVRATTPSKTATVQALGGPPSSRTRTQGGPAAVGQPGPRRRDGHEPQARPLRDLQAEGEVLGVRAQEELEETPHGEQCHDQAVTSAGRCTTPDVSH